MASESRGRWPTLGQVVVAFEKREEPGAMLAFFRNRILADSECDLHWADVRDTNHAAFAKYFQQLYLQAEVWLPGPNKTRRSLGAATVHLGDTDAIERFFDRGAPVVGLPQQLTKGELRNAMVELTMLDPSRGVCMLFVRGHNFVPSRGPYILDCQRLEGSDYCAMLLCGDERVVMHPGLHPNMGSGGGAREADPLVSLHVCAKFLREDDETGECEKAYPRYWDIWALLDKMAGVHYRARH